MKQAERITRIQDIKRSIDLLSIELNDTPALTNPSTPGGRILSDVRDVITPLTKRMVHAVRIAQEHT